MEERVQKIMSAAGIAARRKCEELIRQGRVKVNGITIKLGDKADPEKDIISVDDKIIRPEKKVYLALNKPKGYVTSLAEPGKRTIKELIKIPQKVFPVGRLDADAEGLLILTNDGELANRIAHPRFMTYKTYQVTLDRPFTDFGRLKRGITIEGRLVKIKYYKPIKNGIEITIHEGRKHIVKKIFEKIGYKVKKLMRVQIANIKLGNLGLGKTRFLSREELNELRAIVHVR
ncbi:MAG: pseudouridine synthase [Candidatus Woesearchaeota archaeon]